MESETNANVPGGDLQAWLEGLNRAILDSALDCIITMDAHGRVVEFNPAAARVFGYAREEAVGQELAEFIIPFSLCERHRQGLKHYPKTGEEIRARTGERARRGLTNRTRHQNPGITPVPVEITRQGRINHHAPVVPRG